MPASTTYAIELVHKGHGHPLWEPDPGEELAVELADVGYLSDGAFVRLFNASRVAGDSSNRLGVPEGYVPLSVGEVQHRTPLPKKPKYISSEGISENGAALSATSSGNVGALVQAGGAFSFSCSKQQGALLIMGEVAYRQDALQKLSFLRYITKHHRAWLSFANGVCERGLVLPDLTLVTGCDKTSDWACAAFSEKSGSSNLDFLIGDANAGVWGRWSRIESVDTNEGPERLVPLSMTPSPTPILPAIASSPSISRGPSSTPSSTLAPPATSNQCVFLRGYKMCDRITWLWRKLHKNKDGFTYVPEPLVPHKQATPNSSSVGGPHASGGSSSGPGTDPRPAPDAQPDAASNQTSSPAIGSGTGSSLESSSSSLENAKNNAANQSAMEEFSKLDEDIMLCLQLSLEKEPTIEDTVFNYIFEKSTAELAVVHDDDIVALLNRLHLSHDFDGWIRKIAPTIYLHEGVGMFESSHNVLKPVTSVPNLAGEIERVGDYPAWQGESAEIWIGMWVSAQKSNGKFVSQASDKDVSVKILRTFRKEKGERAVNVWPNRLLKLFPHWYAFDHPHILPLFGLCEEAGRPPAMISPWMRCNAREYIKAVPYLSHRVELMLGVAKALQYLHTYTPQVVHGDVKGVNVLVTGGEAVLGDFGTAKVVEENPDHTNDDEPIKGSIRWMAPELVATEHSSPDITPASDVYAFGCLLLELITDMDPYYDIETDACVTVNILEGKKPSIPPRAYIPRNVMALMTNCWSDSRPSRPGINRVVAMVSKCLSVARKASASFPPPYSARQTPVPEYSNSFESGYMVDVVDTVPTLPTVTESPPATPPIVFQPPMRRGPSRLLNPREVAASLTAVPDLEKAVELLVNLDGACIKTSANKAQTLQLVQRCTTLLKTLGEINQTLRLPLQTCLSIVSTFTSQAQEWSSLGRLASLLKRNDISKEIESTHRQLTDFVMNLIDALPASASPQTRSVLDDLRVWQEPFLVDQQADNEEVTEVLKALIQDESLTKEAVDMSETDFGNIAQLFQETVKLFEKGSPRHQELQVGLHKLLTCRGPVLPCAELPSREISRIGSYPVAGGSTFDIWEGLWLGKVKVALKVLRGVQVVPSTKRRFNREAAIWRQVWSKDHGKTILSFYGICSDGGPHPYMVSPWMENGHINEYLEKHPEADTMSLVKEIASGLEVLHSFVPPIVHGALKGANVLVSDTGHALLSDFGLSKMLEDISGQTEFTRSQGVSDSYRWFAPELLESPASLSIQSDIYSFGMTVLEVLTRKYPWAEIKRTPLVLRRCAAGQRPQRPTSPEVITRGLDDALWNLLQQCWNLEPCNRPNIEEVMKSLPPPQVIAAAA